MYGIPTLKGFKNRVEFGLTISEQTFAAHRCQGLVVAMSASCAHVKAVKRYLKTNGQEPAKRKQVSTVTIEEACRATKTMSVERRQLLDFVVRMRESEEQARVREREGLHLQAEIWRTRARAFDEVYTELKGSGFGRKI